MLLVKDFNPGRRDFLLSSNATVSEISEMEVVRAVVNDMCVDFSPSDERGPQWHSLVLLCVWNGIGSAKPTVLMKFPAGSVVPARESEAHTGGPGR